jgi:hypothetical protein
MNYINIQSELFTELQNHNTGVAGTGVQSTSLHEVQEIPKKEQKRETQRWINQ